MGDKVVGDKFSGDKVAGDKISIYGNVNYYPITLRTALRHQFDPLIEEYTRLFAGRSQKLEAITNWISGSTGGYLAITALAGFGKTALMAALIQSQPQAFAYHFFSATKVPHSREQIYFLRNVVEQMAQWQGREKEDVPERLDQLVALYYQFIDQELPYARILVLDGIDEVTTWPVQNFLPPQLPQSMYVIVTLRDVGQDWMTKYGFAQEETDHLALDGLDREAVIQVLRSAGSTAATIVNDDALLEQFLRVSAYPAQQSLGADPFCVRLLAEDLNAGVLAPHQLSDQSRGLNLYLDGWWKQIKALAGDEAAKDLFSTLTVAQGAIGRSDLEAVNPTLVDDWAEDFFDEVIDQVRHFVAGDEENGYTLAHPRLKRYLRWRLRNLAKYESRLVDYCACWPEHDPPTAYCLAYCARHLANSGRSKALYDLISADWMTAKYAYFQSHRAFAEDLELIAERAVEGGVDDLPSLVRACLVYNELSIYAPPEILAVLAAVGQGKRAMDYAALMPDVSDRAEAYRLIGQALAQQGEAVLARTAFEAAGEMLEEPERSAINGALTANSKRLEATQETFEALKQNVGRAIDWAYPIGDAALVQDAAEIVVRAGWSSRIWQIADLAPDEAVRAWTLAQLAVGLARAGESDAAIEATAEVIRMDKEGALDGPEELAEPHWLAVPALTAVAQAQSLAGKKKEAEEAVNRVLTSARAAGFETEKSEALIAFAWALLDNNRPGQAVEVVRLTISTATTILDPWDQAGVYKQLLPLLLDLDQQEEAVVAEVLIENTIIDLDQNDPQHGEDAIALLESLALGLAEAGYPVLARQAAEVIPVADGRESVLDEIEVVESSSPIGDSAMEHKVLEESAVGPQAMTLGETAEFVAQFNQRLMAGGMPDRIGVYLALQEAARDLAAIDQGQTLWLLFESIRAVDRWWGRV